MQRNQVPLIFLLFQYLLRNKLLFFYGLFVMPMDQRHAGGKFSQVGWLLDGFSMPRSVIVTTLIFITSQESDPSELSRLMPLAVGQAIEHVKTETLS